MFPYYVFIFCAAFINPCISADLGITIALFTEPDEAQEGVILRKVGDIVQLRCEMRSLIDNSPYVGLAYELGWLYPKVEGVERFVESFDPRNTSYSRFLGHALRLHDSGHYSCVLRSKRDSSVLNQRVLLMHTRYLNVQQPTYNVPNCGPRMFVCGAITNSSIPLCIPGHYVCDGRIDCPQTADDESKHVCGSLNSCFGKLPCSDGRCIPSSWCCDPQSADCHVLVRPPCCDEHEHTNEDFPDLKFRIMNVEKHQLKKEVNFLEKTVLIVIASTFLFLVLVILLLTAVFRMHRKRMALQRQYAVSITNEDFPARFRVRRLNNTNVSTRNDYRLNEGNIRNVRPLLYDRRNREHIFDERAQFLECVEFAVNEIERRRAMRRLNWFERILAKLGVDVFSERQAPVFQVGRVAIPLPRLFGKLSVYPQNGDTAVNPTVDVPNLERFHLDGTDTYTLNGRTILLGASFTTVPDPNYPSTFSLPTYVEAVGNSVPTAFIPPPSYTSIVPEISPTESLVNATANIIIPAAPAIVPSNSLTTQPPGYDEIIANDSEVGDNDEFKGFESSTDFEETFA